MQGMTPTQMKRGSATNAGVQGKFTLQKGANMSGTQSALN